MNTVNNEDENVSSLSMSTSTINDVSLLLPDHVKEILQQGIRDGFKDNRLDLSMK